MNKSPSLPMSTIISSDAPLLSPLAEAAPWEALYASTNDITAFPQYYIPPSPSSPIPPSTMLKMRSTTDSASEQEQQLCLPTHQVFDFPEQPASAPSALKQDCLAISINPSAVATSVSTPSKRSASPAPPPPKKRATGERINSKDFIPPDVSGLSKREARLVKNRAAAFLSRQRKREEFECMEIRVAELEQENARLLALTQNGGVPPPAEPKDKSELVSEVEKLKAQLEAAEGRERQLAAELMSKTESKSVPTPPAVKIEEAADLQLPFNSNPRSPAPSPSKSGASLGLMVLLCALPTLLSMPVNSAMPKSFTVPDTPLQVTPSAFDFNSFVPNDYDWSRNSANNFMDLDDVDQSPGLSSSAPTSRRLEFSTSGTSLDAEGGLDGLDISFDTIPADNGKIRVRIHPSSSASSRATSPGVSDSKSDASSSWNTDSEPSVEVSFSPQSFSSSSSLSSVSSSSLASLSPPSSYLSSPSSAGDPFLGVGAPDDYSMPYPSDIFGNMDDSLSGTGGDFGQDVGYGSEYSVGDNGSKRRVRIALKSLPAAGGEGGEWEVQIC